MQPGRKPPSPGPDQRRSKATASTKRDGGQLDKPFVQAIFRADQESASRMRERVEANPFLSAKDSGLSGIGAV